MTELFLGVLCGVALSLFFSFGPAFFSQIRASIQHGFRRAYPFAFGVSAGDVLIVGLMLTVLRNVDLFEALHNVWVASIGGAVLLAMGIYFFRKRVVIPDDEALPLKNANAEGDPRWLTVFVQGFVINFANPLIWIYWVSVVALLTGELDLTSTERYIFFVGLLATTLGLDLLKCKLASLLQRIVTPRLMNNVNKACGVVLVGFAVYVVLSMALYQTTPQHTQQQTPTSTELIKRIHVIRNE